jgi:hypothetical protein
MGDRWIVPAAQANRTDGYHDWYIKYNVHADVNEFFKALDDHLPSSRSS